jgi:hypothetical protein
MPRKSTKSNPINAAEAMEMIMAVEPLKTVSEAAEFIGVAEIRVLELFADVLNLPEAMGWEVIPQEHEHLLNEFKAQAQDIQALPEMNEPSVVESAIAQPQQQAQEPPLVEDEPQPTRRPGRKKKDATALTKKGSTAIENSAETTDNTQNLEEAVLLELSRLRGDKRGSNMAAVEDVAEQERYTRNRKNALTRKVAKLVEDIETQAEFDPVAFVKTRTGSSAEDNLNEIQDVLGKSLGKCQEAVEEIGDNSYANGKTLDLSRLEALMNSNA